MNPILVLAVVAFFAAGSLAYDPGFRLYIFMREPFSDGVATHLPNGTIVIDSKPAVGGNVSIGGSLREGTGFFMSGFSGKITSLAERPNGDIVITAACTDGAWGTTGLRRLAGKISVTLNDKFAVWTAECTSPMYEVIYKTKANGSRTYNTVYGRDEPYDIAEALMGSTFKDVQLVNYAVYMNPFLPYGESCAFYYDKYEDSKNIQPLKDLIVGNHKEHCGVMTKDRKWFMHTDVSQGAVIKSHMIQTKVYFRYGYVFKKRVIIG